MKQSFLRKLMLIAVLLTSSHAFAYDFESDGKYYNILSDEEQTVEITYETTSYNSYSGDIQIPQSVNYNGKTMKVVQIGTEAFYKCSNMTSIEIPEGIQTIKGGAFSECISLTSLVIPNSVIALCGENQQNTFYGCTSLETVTLGENVKFIGQSAFNYCTSLKSINIPNSVDSIGSYAFAGCTKLKSITIPESVSVMNSYIFYGCTNLATITMEGFIPPTYSEVNSSEYFSSTLKVPLGSLSLYKTATFWKNFTQNGSIEEYKIDIEINGINYNIISFEDKTAEVTYKGDSSYPRENAYTGDVVIPNQITYNGNTFDVIKIGTQSFYYCPEMTSLSIPGSVTTIEEYNMSECGNLKELRLEDGENSLDGTLDISIEPIETLYLGRDINEYWSFNETIKEVTIGENVTLINTGEFQENTTLEKVKIESSDLTIGGSAFRSCSNLTEINLDGVTNIGSSAFRGCSSLKKLEIPEKVTAIGDDAFYGCLGLNTIIINGLGTLGSNVFENCTGDLIVNCNIPDESTSNNALTGAFYSSNFTSLTLGKNVETIGRYAFYNCEWLKSLVIPESVKNIGNYAFFKCTGLNEVICESSTPATAYSSTFTSVPTTATLYVPMGSSEIYASATGWSTFTNIVEDDEITGIEDTLADNEVNVSVENGNIIIGGTDDVVKVEVYSVNGQCVYNGNATTISVNGKGLYIVKVNGKSFKVMM